MIVLTGAAGFIGSCMLAFLNQAGYYDIVLVDDSREDKKPNWDSKRYTEKVNRLNLNTWLKGKEKLIQMIVHLGARTDTTEFDKSIFDELNLNYSKQLWVYCATHQIPLIYASSAATYGDGKLGYDDDHSLIPSLKPLNPYGESKNEFDKWVLQQEKTPYFWAGLKFFNVYGPNEYHKGRMASVILHAVKQIKNNDSLKLFKSHNPDYAHGGQRRDFIYVMDLVQVIYFLMENRKHSGIYNLGTGVARTFNDLAKCCFDALSIEPDIQYIDTPIDIRDTYQYYTCANMTKLRAIGYTQPFSTLEEGINDYISRFLTQETYY